MSWEKMVPDIKPCSCGKGTITYITEMDDWNRVRNHKEINCPVCREQYRIKDDKDRAKDKKRDGLHFKAKNIAVSRYLDQWLAMFSGLNKKAAWQLYTNGSEYPTLATFYKHVKEEGVLPYMVHHFNADFEKTLDKMGVEDSEIIKLLHQKKRI